MNIRIRRIKLDEDGRQYWEELYKECVATLQDGMLLSSKDSSVVKKALEEAFINANTKLLNWLEETGKQTESGSTATAIFLRNDSHVGDSSVVLSRSGKAEVLTDPHCPCGNNKVSLQEIRRIREAGGWGNVAKEFGIPVKFQRFWLWTKRQNLTYRPHRQLTPEEETQSVGQLKEVSNKAHNGDLKLFLEVEVGPDLHPIQLPETTKEDILIFFKLYDPIKEELIYVGRLFVKVSGSPYEILTKLNKMAGFSSTQQIELYKELKFEPSVMCEPIHKKSTFRANQLGDGDILCFQKSPPVQCLQQCRYPDVPSFFEYVHNRLVVHFRSLAKPKEDAFCLQLSNIFNYDEVVESVARQLLVDVSSKIWLTPHNCYSQQPEPIPIRYRGADHLSDMLVQNNQTAHILYYEVLDIPLPELECLKTLEVSFHHATKEEVVKHCITLPEHSTVADLISDLKRKVELSHPNVELRLLEVFYHKIYKIFQTSETIENINDQNWTLRAEEIPEEEKNCGAHDHIIHVYHFTKDTSQNQMSVQNFGKPFLLVIHDGETLADVKVRIQKKLRVPVPDLCKWKFVYISLGRAEYLQDTDIVSTRFQRRELFAPWEQYLGLEHSDIAPNRLHAANQVMNPSLTAPLIPATASPITNKRRFRIIHGNRCLYPFLLHGRETTASQCTQERSSQQTS